MKNSSLEIRHFSSFFKNEYGIWITEKNFNGIFFLPKDSTNAEFIGFFENESLFGRNLFDKIIEVGYKLFFIPSSGRSIHIFDIKKKFFSEIPVLNFNNQRYGTAGLHSSFLYGIYIYIYQCCDSSILRLNTISNEIEEIDLYPKKILNEYNLYWNRRVILNGDVVIMYSIINKEFVYYNLSSEKILYKWLIKEYTFIDFSIIEDSIYCIDKYGSIVKLEENNVIKHLGKIKGGNYLFNKIHNELWIYDTELQRYIKCIIRDEILDIASDAINISGDVINPNDGFIIQNKAGEYWCDGLTKNKPILCSDFEFPQGICVKNDAIYENVNQNLKQYIQLILKLKTE